MRLKLDDTNNFSENSNINQDGDTNQNEDDIIKDKYEKLTQLAGIYSCLHNILVNLKSSGDENKRYCFVEVNNEPEDFFNKIIVEVIIPLEKFISTNKEYMKVNCIFDWENYGVNSDILHKIVETIKLVKNICDNRYKHVEDMSETIMFLDGLMRIGCYIMDVLIFHYNEIYKEKKQHEEVMTFSDGFKALLKDVGIFGGAEEIRYKNLVSDLMRLYSFVLYFNESIDKNLKASYVFSDEKFKCAYNLILNVFRNFYYVFLFMVKFYSLDLIVKKMIGDNVMEYHIKNIFNFTYNFSCIIRVFLYQFLSKKHSNG